MKGNIEQAYLAEQEYLKTDHQGKQLVDILAELDYTLSEYFYDKKEYLLKQNNTYVELLDNDSLADIYDKVTGSMEKEEQAIYMSHNKDTFAWIGTDDFDDEKAKALGIEVHKMKYIGGTMITGPEDLSGAIIISKKVDIDFDYFAKKLCKFLVDAGENAILDGNDILVGNKKVFGGAGYYTDTMYCFLFEATFSDHYDLIKEFCEINENKQPGFITKTNKEALIKEILSWLQRI